MNREEIKEKITVIIRETAADAADEFDEDASIIEDIGLSSIEQLFVISGIENEFSVKVTEKEIREVFILGDLINLTEALLKK